MIPVLPNSGFTLYVLATLVALAHWIFNKKALLTLSRRLTLLAFLVQTLNLGIHVGKVGYPFLLGARDSYSFSAWVLAGLLLVLFAKNRFETAGVFILPAVMIL